MQPFQQQMQPSANNQFNAAVTELEGICKQRLWQYQLEWNNGRSADNDISFWRNFVAKYYAPDSKRRFCLSALKHQDIMSRQSTKEKWHCSICKEFSDKCRIEYSFEEMAENFQSKFEKGKKEFLNLGPGKIRISQSNQIEILYKTMKLGFMGQHGYHKSMGELVVVLDTKLKILQWNCCMRRFEVAMFSRTSLNPPFASLTETPQLANTKESQGGINESGGDQESEECMMIYDFPKSMTSDQVRQGTMHRQGSIAETKPELDVGSGSGNDSSFDILTPVVCQRLGSTNSPQNSNNLTESQRKWVPFSDMAVPVCVNSNSRKTLKRSLPNNGFEMDPHSGQQATQQRIEVNTNNNDSNNTAPSNLEEEEILRQEHHHRLDNLIDDIFKTKSIDELNALIDSFTN